ncbi:MAG: hypothetical protein HYZ50_10825 [Deltaproteobacteria bacterium]|nr:hypothetical protein [Deltaproteobacteria bacterium]
MNKWMYRGACLGMAVTMLSGCAMVQGATGIRGRDLWPGIGFASFSQNQTIEGPQALIDQQFEEIDLALLLDPSSGGSSSADYAKKLQETFAKFYATNPTSPGSERARNAIQDRIVAASNQRCAAYKQFLKRYDAETNILLGVAAVATGGAGAIVKAADTARALAGITSILSGTRAEINEDNFQQRTVQVLTSGFEERRKEILADMLRRRGIREDPDGTTVHTPGEDLTTYTVERAIGDAIRYHDHCSLVAGLEFAAYAVDRVNDPGLKALDRTFNHMRKLYRLPESGAGEILLPLNEYNEASAVHDALTAEEINLTAACEDPLQSEAGDTQAQTAQKAKLKKECKKLQPQITKALTAAKAILTDTNKERATSLQDSLPKRHEAVYTAALNGADRAGAEASLRAEQDEARQLSESFTSLAAKLQQLFNKTRSLLQKIADLA